MRWSVEQRLEFIDFRLFWDGQVNRSDLVDTFGISVPQASLDLSRYQQLGAENLRYDKSLKTYVVAEHFQPVVRELTARHYLSQLRSVADGVVDASETWLGSVPPYAVVPGFLLTFGFGQIERSSSGNTTVACDACRISIVQPTWSSPSVAYSPCTRLRRI